MDNMEYIKSLEERIDKLEKLIATIKLDNNENITFTNCQIQGMALQSCKDVTIKDVTIKDFTVDALGFASFNAKIENANIHNFQNQKGKVRIKNCTINNKEE